MTSPLEIFRHWWEYYRERPFGRLSRIFAERIFRGGGDTDAEGIDLGIGLVLTLLALPGGFVSILMFVKYSTLLSWMRGAPNIDPVSVALPDEYFFIALSMTVTGTVAVWRWDALFPDRRDYMNLVPLPVSTTTLFAASFAAVMYLAALIALDVNAASAVLFPLGVGASQTSFLFFLKFAAVHAVIVGFASIFSFFAVLALLGFLLAILTPAAFRRISPLVRSLVVMYFVTLLCTSFALPEFLQGLSGSSHRWASLLPSIWFLGLCQTWHGQTWHGEADPALLILGRIALPGLAVTLAASLCFYAAGYRRHFLRIPEMSEMPAAQKSTRLWWLKDLFDRFVLQSPFQRGGFSFVWKTLLRSEAHRLAFAAIYGLGVVLASQALVDAVQSGLRRGLSPSGEILSVPFILAFLVIVGLRVVFELPADLRANWIFRFTLNAEEHECRPLARKIILTFVLPWILLLACPAYIYLQSWQAGCVHTLIVVCWSMLLTNAVLIGYRKLPFTCSLPVFEQHSIVTLMGCILGYFFFAVITPHLESWALLEPIRMVIFVPIAAIGWFITRHMNQESQDAGRRLLFDDGPTGAFEILQLGD